MAKTVQEIAEAIFKMVKEVQGVKKLKATDLIKAMQQLYGDDVDKQICKDAIKELMNSGRCVYTYFGGSYIELPHKEGAANRQRGTQYYGAKMPQAGYRWTVWRFRQDGNQPQPSDGLEAQRPPPLRLQERAGLYRCGLVVVGCRRHMSQS